MEKNGIPAEPDRGADPALPAADGADERFRSTEDMIVRMLIALAVVALFLAGVPSMAEGPAVPVVYPKENSVVGGKVNVVLDPGSDWSAIPFFQVVAEGVEYPRVDTSTGKHAFQGVALKPGLNTITIKVFPAKDKEKKEAASKQITVFSMVELFTTRYAPAGYSRSLFHSRENEESCSGCHPLEVAADAPQPKKPEDAICHACHRLIPTGEHIHGPAAVWNCIGCHNPDIYPVKYQFTAEDPWKVAKTVQPVEPAVVTIWNDALFRPGSAVIFGATAAKGAKQEKARNEALEKLKDQFREVFEHIALNPGDRVRVEAHTDSTPLPKPKGKSAAGFRDNLALTKARASAVASLLKQFGLSGKNRVIAVGMGDTLPKAPNTTPEGRERNGRIEIVLFPSDVKVINSAQLPLLKDRERVMVSLSYANGPAVKKFKVLDKVPANTQYLKGTSYFRGKGKDPKVKGRELVWELGDPGQNFTDALSYVIKKGKKADPVTGAVAIAYTTFAGKTITREFDPKNPSRQGYSVLEACSKCHPAMLSAPFKHGPVDAGLCTICHDPHASGNSAWLRIRRWELCTTCHDEKGMANDVHVLAGYVKGITHPTRGKHDPVRPGKRFSCASCHEPHSAWTKDLFQFETKARNELCAICHRKK